MNNLQFKPPITICLKDNIVVKCSLTSDSPRVVSGLGGPGEAEEVVKEVPVEEVSAGCGGPEAEDGQGNGGCDEGW